ncbi:hypothetical protein CRUP_026970 [Coryphaenoides rupestris]|nr:hypothetical protein CRUP_026970 [Coryphaenoides rupestris]
MEELFGETSASKDTVKTFANTIEEEVASYKAASGIPVDDPSERVFSTAGDIVTAKRSTLSPDNVDILIFLKKNLKL